MDCVRETCTLPGCRKGEGRNRETHPLRHEPPVLAPPFWSLPPEETNARRKKRRKKRRKETEGMGADEGMKNFEDSP